MEARVIIIEMTLSCPNQHKGQQLLWNVSNMSYEPNLCLILATFWLQATARRIK